jgi:hypothetical protein
MEHASVALVVLICIALLLIGGWVLYIHKVNETNSTVATSTNLSTAQHDSERLTAEATHAVDWVSMTANFEFKEVEFEYPSFLPIIRSEMLYLIKTPRYPNYSFPLTNIDDITSVEMTPDFKYLFYSKSDREYPLRLTMYKATLATKSITKVTDYDLQLLKLQQQKESIPDEEAGMSPLIIHDFIVYNKQQGDTMLGTIATLETNTQLYSGPCGLDRRGNVSVSPDKSHIAWSCQNDGIYISDWKNTTKIVNFTDDIHGPVINFMDNERVRFGNITEGDSTRLTPHHFVNINGTDLRLEQRD